MSKRTWLRRALGIALALAGPFAVAQEREGPDQLNTMFVSGVISNYEPNLGLVTINDVTIYVGETPQTLGLELQIGDAVTVLAAKAFDSSVVSALAMQFISTSATKEQGALNTESITGTGRKSLAGSGKQSITGTGLKKVSSGEVITQSITGTGASRMSITGTGRYSITGTGR